eukprot:6185656-Pleurochrysis_carterae.AAC.1
MSAYSECVRSFVNMRMLICVSVHAAVHVHACERLPLRSCAHKRGNEQTRCNEMPRERQSGIDRQRHVSANMDARGEPRGARPRELLRSTQRQAPQHRAAMLLQTGN